MMIPSFDPAALLWRHRSLEGITRCHRSCTNRAKMLRWRVPRPLRGEALRSLTDLMTVRSARIVMRERIWLKLLRNIGRDWEV